MCCIHPKFYTLMFFFFLVAWRGSWFSLCFIIFICIKKLKHILEELALEGIILHYSVCVFIHVPMNLWYAVHPRGGTGKEDEVLGNGAKGFFFLLLLPSFSLTPLLSCFSEEICVNTAGGVRAGRPAPHENR